MEVRKVPQIWKEALACPMPTLAWVTAGQVNDNKLARIFGEAGGVLGQGGQL